MQWMYGAAISYATKKLQGPGAWGYSLEFLVGVCRAVLQILTLFQTKTMSCFTPVFRPGLYEIMSSSLRLEQQQKMIY